MASRLSTLGRPGGFRRGAVHRRDDIADVGVAALTQDGHAGRTHELTGPHLLTFADTAAELTRATGRDIAYMPVTSEE